MNNTNWIEKAESYKYRVYISTNQCQTLREVKDVGFVPTKIFRNVTLMLNLPASGLASFLTEQDELVIVPWMMIVYIIPEKTEQND